jgi:hypothetical protein
VEHDERVMKKLKRFEFLIEVNGIMVLHDITPCNMVTGTIIMNKLAASNFRVEKQELWVKNGMDTGKGRPTGSY